MSLSETVEGEIMMLADENPPTDYDFLQGDFSGGAAVAAESSADAAEGQSSGRGFRHLAGELGPARHEG